MDKKTIVFIVGMGHSGSTIMDKSMGNIDGCFSYGELVNLSKVIRQNNYCTCGKKITDCSFWNSVNKSLERNFDKSLQKNPDKFFFRIPFKKHIFNLILCKRETQIVKLFSDHTQAIYDYTFKKGFNVLIDSSKDIFRVLLLKKHLSKQYDIRIIHLIRNPVDVTNSYLKSHSKVKYPGMKDFQTYSRNSVTGSTPKSTFSIILRWISKNILITFVFKIFFRKNKYQIVRFENVIEDVQMFNKMLVGLDLGSVNKISLNSKVTHIVTGNASRYSDSIKLNSGPLHISTAKKKLIQITTWPIYAYYRKRSI